MNRDDWRQVLRSLPAAALLVVALYVLILLAAVLADPGVR